MSPIIALCDGVDCSIRAGCLRYERVANQRIWIGHNVCRPSRFMAAKYMQFIPVESCDWLFFPSVLFWQTGEFPFYV